jgi:hypothetical protein
VGCCLKAPSNLADSDEYFRGTFCTMKMAGSYKKTSKHLRDWCQSQKDTLRILIYIVFGGNNRKLAFTIWNFRRQSRSEDAETPIEHIPIFFLFCSFAKTMKDIIILPPSLFSSHNNLVISSHFFIFDYELY